MLVHGHKFWENNPGFKEIFLRETSLRYKGYVESWNGLIQIFAVPPEEKRWCWQSWWYCHRRDPSSFEPDSLVGKSHLGVFSFSFKRHIGGLPGRLAWSTHRVAAHPPFQKGFAPNRQVHTPSKTHRYYLLKLNSSPPSPCLHCPLLHRWESWANCPQREPHNLISRES